LARRLSVQNENDLLQVSRGFALRSDILQKS
jgi:hypothetical protein